jgi:hypothetical protein
MIEEEVAATLGTSESAEEEEDDTDNHNTDLSR